MHPLHTDGCAHTPPTPMLNDNAHIDGGDNLLSATTFPRSCPAVPPTTQGDCQQWREGRCSVRDLARIVCTPHTGRAIQCAWLLKRQVCQLPGVAQQRDVVSGFAGYTSWFASGAATGGVEREYVCTSRLHSCRKLLPEGTRCYCSFRYISACFVNSCLMRERESMPVCCSLYAPGHAS